MGDIDVNNNPRTTSLRILFICGSTEPGRDGVGDYTLRLASELTKQGHHVAIVALRDKFIEKSELVKQPESGFEIQVFRLSLKESQNDRMKKGAEFSNNFSPDWISLQFVPYAYSSQGVPFGLSTGLALFSKTAKWHFMIHESYLAEPRSVKNRIVRLGQIRTLKSLVKILNPQVTHTSIRDYQTRLEKIGISSGLLGLFGNIQITEGVDETAESSTLNAVYFGAAPKEINFETFANGINVFLSKSNKNLKLQFCGSSGKLGEKFISYLKQSVDQEKFVVESLGRMESVELSCLFSKSDFAISRVNPQLIGKSGAAIAMLEHGLPIWVPMAKSQENILSSINFRVNQCFADLNSLVENNEIFKAESRLPIIAEQLANDLRD